MPSTQSDYAGLGCLRSRCPKRCGEADSDCGENNQKFLHQGFSSWYAPAQSGDCSTQTCTSQLESSINNLPHFFSAALAVACLSSAAAGPGSALLVYSTYLGSFADEQGRSVALDRDSPRLCHRLHLFCCFPEMARTSPDHGVDVYAARFDPDELA